MKKCNEILEDIAAATARLTDTTEAEKELNREKMMYILSTGTHAEKAAALTEYQAAKARCIAELEQNTRTNVLIQILKDNAAQAYFAENIDTICNSWNRYAGKPHGEKTAEKIRTELIKAIGARCCITNYCGAAEINVYFDCNARYPFDQLTFGPIPGNENKPALIDNKIQPINAAGMQVYYCGAYVDDPDTHTDAIYTAHAAIKAAEQELVLAVSNYNALCRGDLERASVSVNVKDLILQ